MPGFVTKVHEKGPPPTDFENPVRDGSTPDGRPHYRVTVCDDNTPGEWKIYKKEARVHVEHVAGTSSKGIARKTSATDGSVDIGGHALKDSDAEESSDFDIEITPTNGDPPIKRRLTVRVVHCPSATRGHWGDPVPNPPQE